MNVDSIVNNLQGNLGRLGQSLFLQGDGAFSENLTLGQVLKGKVLRHYEGGRYEVSFAGQEKVVDSTVPLKVGEQISGRVVALGDKVHLQRVDVNKSKEGNQQTEAGNNRTLNAKERLATQLFDKYQGRLNGQDRQLLMRMLSRSGNPELTALSSLLLNKSGVSLNQEFIKSIFRVLETERPANLAKTEINPQLQISNEAATRGNESAVKEFSEVLYERLALQADNLVSKGAETVRRDGGAAIKNNTLSQDHNFQSGDDDGDSSERFLGTWLLNAQSDGSVAHRVISVPIWFGERLVEVSVALFSQREQAGLSSDAKYRKVVLSLDTDHLGHVEVIINIANTNLKIDFHAQDEEAADILAGYLPELDSLLEQSGWTVDGINYATVLPSARGEVVRSVVEHYVTQDSINRLV